MRHNESVTHFQAKRVFVCIFFLFETEERGFSLDLDFQWSPETDFYVSVEHNELWIYITDYGNEILNKHKLKTSPNI